MSRLTAWVRSLKHRLFARRDGAQLPLVREGFPVVCCWSAKAGCTTLLKWFLQHNGLLEEATRHADWIHNYRTELLIQDPAYESRCHRLVRCDGVRVIKVIRDPAKRAVSSYLHYLRADQQEWPGAIMLRGWKAANGLGAQKGVSFQQFLQFGRDLERHRKPREPHVRPQYDSVWDPHVDAFIPLEHLAAGLEETERICGLPHVDIRSLSESVHHNRPSGRHQWPSDASRLPATSHTLEELGIPPAELLLDNVTIPLVRLIYARDYTAYARHYSPPPCKAVP